MSKLGMLAAGAVGYVLGARAGRERYDQIVYQAQRFWTNPTVQKAASEAQERARDAAPIVAEKVGDAAKSAAGAAGGAAKSAAGAAVSAVKRDSGDSESTSATRDESTGSARAGSNGSGSEPKVSHL
jgi:hypothetical protein